jgi:hypothetical protein
MILIINQHKGSDTDLERCLDNFVSKAVYPYFYMYLVIDQEPNYKTTEIINNYLKYSDVLTIEQSSENHGLAYSRNASYTHGYKLLLDRGESVSHILLGSTNSLFNVVSLSEDIHGYLSEFKGLTLMDVSYDSSDTIKRNRIGLKNITFSDFFNLDNRPDYSQLISTPVLGGFDVYGKEKYNPEDVLMYKNSIGDQHIVNVINDKLIDAWYNSTGLSKTFSRETVVNNKLGFYNRAKFFIDEYLKGNISLSEDRLRHLTYDLVTLPDEVPIKKYKDTIIEPLITWSINKWVSNKDYDHKLKFIE